MNITSTRTPHLAVAVVATASLVAVASPAQARGGDDIVRRGDCAASTDWKLKVGTDDGRLEVEGEIDSNRVGQSWTWLIRHNGIVAARGTRTHAGSQRVVRGPSPGERPGRPRRDRVPGHEPPHARGLPRNAHVLTR